MSSFWAMVVANCKMTVRNRQAIFWNLAFPAIFILIFGAVFGNGNETTFDVGVAGPEGPLRERVVTGLETSDAFDVHLGSEADELEALENNERSVVLTVPGSLDGGQEIGFSYNENGGPTGSAARLAVENALLQILGGGSGVPIAQRPVSTLNLTFMDFFVPGILAMSIMNSGVIGLSTAFTSYREKGILRRIKVTPFALWKFILARVVAQMLVIVVDCLILVAVAKLVWGLTIRGNWLLSLGVVIVGSLTFLAIGYAISSIARNTESAASYANLITFPMLFLSGVFFSVESMPGWLQPVLDVLPLRYLVDGLRQPMMYGRGLGTIWSDVLVLLGIFAAAMIFAVRFFKWDATVR
jgi:ABC-2 type transport system permease protein